MDFSILNEHFVLVVLVACLVIGYVIKHATFLKWIPNNDIPVILAAVGATVNSMISGLSIETFVYGAVMGLASTGLHQGFKSFVEGSKNSEKDMSGIVGLNGNTSYLHIAYANSADGSDGFSISDSTNKSYIGQYTDFEQTDSTDYTKYVWTKLKKSEKEDRKELIE